MEPETLIVLPLEEDDLPFPIEIGREYISTRCGLPNYGQRCLCFGNKTHYGSDDMEEHKGWHEVIFNLLIADYKLRDDEFPQDPEETLLADCEVVDSWKIVDSECNDKVIGVTYWTPIINMN